PAVSARPPYTTTRGAPPEPAPSITSANPSPSTSPAATQNPVRSSGANAKKSPNSRTGDPPNKVRPSYPATRGPPPPPAVTSSAALLANHRSPAPAARAGRGDDGRNPVAGHAGGRHPDPAREVAEGVEPEPFVPRGEVEHPHGPTADVLGDGGEGDRPNRRCP